MLATSGMNAWVCRSTNMAPRVRGKAGGMASRLRYDECVSTAVLTTGTADEFFARSRERARKLDRGDKDTGRDQIGRAHV